MKSFAKLSLVAALATVTFTACDLVGGKPTKKVETPADSTTIDSVKIESLEKDSLKNRVDTTAKAF